MHQGLIEIIVGDLTRIDYLWVAILGFVALDAPMHIRLLQPEDAVRARRPSASIHLAKSFRKCARGSVCLM